MPKLSPPRGTQDIYGEKQKLFDRIYDAAFNSAQVHGFQKISTPIFESLEVFEKPLGASSDIVGKELYQFEDRKGKNFALRPEGTACVLRAASALPSLPSPSGFYYQGPMFRYERPQSGRYRQFHQVGVELLGSASVQSDLDVLSSAFLFLNSLKLKNYVTLKINYLGSSEALKSYRDKLAQFLEASKDKLSEDSQRRLTQNPLRILDSKDEGDQKIIQNAPKLLDEIKDKSHFDEVLKALDLWKVNYEVDPFLIRGIDYYTGIVFEFQTTKLSKAHNTVLAGGRYDHLMKQFGLPDESGSGWAAGVERLALVIEDLNIKSLDQALPMVGIAALSSEANQFIADISYKLRNLGIRTLCDFSGNLSKQLKKITDRKCTHALVIGDEEMQSGILSLKELKTGQSQKLTLDQITQLLLKKL